MNYYVYAHYKIGATEPYYIGSGKGKRFENVKNGRNAHWTNTARKHGVCIEIIQDGMTKEESLDLECNFIAMYGREDLGEGPLVNMTDGWDGTCGWKCSDQTKGKISQTLTGKYSGEKNPMYGKHHTQETNERQGAIKLGKRRPELCGANNPIHAIDRNGERNPFYGKHHTPEAKERMRVARRRYLERKRTEERNDN